MRTDLHEYIQAEFGWWNYHMHQFNIDGERYGHIDFLLGILFDETCGVSRACTRQTRIWRPHHP